MSKHSKKNLDVILPIQRFAKKSIDQTGFFHNGVTFEETKIQKGIIRTNCIDCLDRTNAAQFIICKEALSQQLKSLNFITESTDLDYDSDIINILTEMFHDHGDTIALQYGGSNLVNTMDSYRRINQWSSHTRDTLNSIKRMYSNSFMDLIRQDAINLFLGNYIHDPSKIKLWEMQNDVYLHNKLFLQSFRDKVSYQNWFNVRFIEPIKAINYDESFYYSRSFRKLDPFPEYNDNWFNEFYGQREFQSFHDIILFNMNSNVGYFPSNSNLTTKFFDYSPFQTRKPFFKPRTTAQESLPNNPDGRENSYRLKENEGIYLSDEELQSRRENPQTLKTFLSERIAKFRDFRSNESDNELANGSYKSASKGEVNLFVQVSTSDNLIYSNQLKVPLIPESVLKVNLPDPEVDSADIKIYQKWSSNLSGTDGFLNSAKDVQTYVHYAEGALSNDIGFMSENYFK